MQMIGYVAVLILAAIALVLWLYNRYYFRATNEIAFVRTGLGGQKVVRSGGAFVFPVFHEVLPVNQSTNRLTVRRDREASLLTRDRLRVDVTMDFYTRVKSDEKSIALAAQTLGDKTMDSKALYELMEGKFVDAIRAAAANSTMESLHEDRHAFVEEVTRLAGNALEKNGLELETLSLSAFNQTGMEFFNPSNAFDAEGLNRLTEEIERRKKSRNDIEQDTIVQILSKNLESEKSQLKISQETEAAKLQQNQELESERAKTDAEIARDAAERKRDAEIAGIAAEQEVERANIQKELVLAQEEVQKRLAIKLAEQEREIGEAAGVVKTAKARAMADEARANAISAEEKIHTIRETEITERKKMIDLILTSLESERTALREIKTSETRERVAQTQANIDRLEAEAFSQSTQTKAEGYARRNAVEVDHTRALAEAENAASPEVLAARQRMALIDKLEGIIRESAKPMEKIGDVRIIDMGHGGTASGNEAAGGLGDQLVNSALRYRAQAPLVDQLLQELDLAQNLTTDASSLVQPSVKKEQE